MRRRRHWGWGFEHEPPDRDQAAALAAHLGFGSPELEPPGRIALPPPRVEVPPQDDVDRALHAHGSAYLDVVRALRGEFPHPPDAVIRPADEDELLRVLEWCEARNLAVIPYGGGTSVVGGVDPIAGPGHDGVVSLDLERLDRVLEIDPISRAARIQAGAAGTMIDARLHDDGWTLRFFPQSYERSTLGGWIATRAAGHFATGPTHIDDLVEAVRAVTARGEVWESRRLPASGAGPSPDRLLLGSEGTLAVITEAWVRILPRDEPRWSARVEPRDFDVGLELMREIVQSGLRPSQCRLIEGRELALTMAGDGLGPVLLLGFEGDLGPVGRAREICQRHFSSVREGGGRRWRMAFLSAPYVRDTLVGMGVLTETFETAVTWDRLPRFVEDVKAATTEALGEGIVTCRITHAYPDGAAPYFTVVAPARRGEEEQQWAEIKRAAAGAVLAGGGTITHHHAVGREHRPWYDRQRPEPFATALRAAKAALDPGSRLNPGVLLDP
jgi:alkyldihydroxyacetonephosphate synthase